MPTGRPADTFLTVHFAFFSPNGTVISQIVFSLAFCSENFSSHFVFVVSSVSCQEGIKTEATKEEPTFFLLQDERALDPMLWLLRR